MTNENTPLKLVAICNTITNATNLKTLGDDYVDLINLLNGIIRVVDKFAFIEVSAVDNIDWAKTIPVMHRLIIELQEDNYVKLLKNWHYVNNNDHSDVQDLITKSRYYLNFIDNISIQ